MNNNPGNLEYNREKWTGLIGSDGRFCRFESPETGLRAMGKLLRNYNKI